ncbi:MAG: TOBE domain-containing protein, partial [Alphaproteobacteria bacterium]
PNDVLLSAPYPRHADGLDGVAEAVIAVRPEVMRIGARGRLADQGLDVVLDGKVVNRIYLGEQTDYSVVTDRLGKILVRVPKTADAQGSDFAVGTDVAVGWRHAWGLALHDR